jgi:hypothetical protein
MFLGIYQVGYAMRTIPEPPAPELILESAPPPPEPVLFTPEVANLGPLLPPSPPPPTPPNVALAGVPGPLLVLASVAPPPPPATQK